MSNHLIAVIRGGPDTERQVSLETGSTVLSALLLSPYKARDIVVSRKGEWIVDGYLKSPAEALAGCDAVFNALHGRYGEGGGVQQLFHQYKINHTGSGIYPSAIAINKALAKQYAQKLGLQTPQYFRVRREAIHDPYLLATQISRLFGPEYVIKPNMAGSTHGLYFADNVDSLAFGLSELLFDYDDLLVEEKIRGTEIASGCLERYRNESWYHLPTTEVLRPEIKDQKIQPKTYNQSTTYRTPAVISSTNLAQIKAATRQMYQSLGLSQYALADFIVNETGIYFLEINSQPSLTPRSIFPQAADAVGEGIVSLVQHLVNDTVKRSY